MPVQFTCEHCGKTLRVREELVGKRVKCPKCQGIVRVPAEVAIKEAPEESWFLQTEDGETYGPVRRTELDRWLEEGRITADCQVLKEGSDQWHGAPDLYPRLAPETTPAAPAKSSPPNPQRSQAPQIPAAAASVQPTPAVESPATAKRSSPAAPAQPAKSTPDSGSGSADFVAPGPAPAPAKQVGPFDFAPSETSPTSTVGPLDFGSQAAIGTRGRIAGKKTRTGKAKSATAGEAGDKSKVVALLLAFFLGFLGIHRFYLGYTLLGALMLVTLGGCGIWAFVDFLLIAIGKVDRDAQGRPLG
jgi:phage FluMu protein Com